MYHRPFYSYRYDATVPDFPDDAPLFVFDAVCVACTAFVRFVLAHDRNGQFRFTPAQGPLAAALFHHYGLSNHAWENGLLIADGQAWIKTDALIEILRRFGGAWRLAVCLRVLPRVVRDWIYDQIVQRRYRLFGKRDTCFKPSGDLGRRFLA